MPQLTTNIIDRLLAAPRWNYHGSGPAASEPAALACLGLAAHAHGHVALPMARWLAKLQGADGAVGIMQTQSTPAWPTSLAILAWLAMEPHVAPGEFDEPLRRALGWSLNAQGRTAPRSPQVGHDTTIPGWSWAADTHAWMEPTCLFVLALKAAGYGDHFRTRSGVLMIVDRLLNEGGCNFGNTRVLGQQTLPHVQATGLAMTAVAGETTSDLRIAKSLDYLQAALQSKLATASLCYSLLGLTAHGRRPSQAESLLHHCADKELQQGDSCYKLALLLLASVPDKSWLPPAGRPRSLAQ